MSALRIGVIGAGFAGCAAAVALARDHHRVTLLEAVETPAPVGAGIMLQPSGMFALAQLGLLDQVLAHGERCTRLRCVQGRRVLFDLPYSARDPSLFGLGLHRGALFETLFAALGPAGVDVHLGVAAATIERRCVIDKSGGRHGPFDLVVVADGARSKVRRALGHALRDDEYPWGALWFVARDPERRFRDELFQSVHGARSMLGLLPTGRAPRELTPHVSFFFSVRLDEIDALRARGLAAFKDAAATLAPECEPVLDQLDSLDQLLVARYRDVHMARLDHERIVYIGDAAHAMSPQLGQGSNLALLDALELAACIRADAALERALPAFSRARRSQLSFYQWATRLLTPFFQGDSLLLGTLRDVSMPLASRAPVLRGQMVATMCGIKQGVFQPSMPIAPAGSALLLTAA